MSDKARLAALARIAAMKKEADLMALARVEARRGDLRARIAALDTAAMASREVVATDVLSLVAQESFGRLISGQRAELDKDLAEQTEVWRMHRDAAALSFGRSQVLDTLQGRIAGQTVQRRARHGPDGF